MAKTIIEVVRDLGRAARLQATLTLSDAQLLERFALQRDEAAFEALLHRHGPLVFGVCRRLLYDAHDVEDAFQATFLVLARKAGGIDRRSLLGNWLYGVASRIACRARKNACRRQDKRCDFDLNAVPGVETSTDPDVAFLLHEEVQRLPDKYRGPVVLCYLQGQTNEEASTRLQCPVGTVKTRLSKARELLRSRLARRGVTLTAGLMAANTLMAAAPAALRDGTFRAALSSAAGNTVVGGASTQALALSTGVLRTMWLTNLKTAAAVILSIAVISGGLAYHGLAVEETAKGDKKTAKPKEDKDAILGTWKVTAFESLGKDVMDTPEGKKIKDATVTITADKMVFKSEVDTSEFTYHLDPTAKPKEIDLRNTTTRRIHEGVYSLEGDTLKICTDIERGRPKEVAAKEGSRSVLKILKRETKNK